MSSRIFRPGNLAIVLLGFQLFVFAAGTWLGYARPEGVPQLDHQSLYWGISLMIPFPLVGAFIARKLPRHPIGWVLLLGWIGVRGPVLAVADVVGRILALPAPVLIAVTLLLPAALAGSAATLAGGWRRGGEAAADR